MAPSIWQLLIVLVIVLLLFGTKRLRNLGGDLGSAIKGFRGALSEPEETAEPQQDEASFVQSDSKANPDAAKQDKN